MRRESQARGGGRGGLQGQEEKVSWSLIWGLRRRRMRREPRERRAPETGGEGKLEFDLEAAEEEDEEKAKREKEEGEDNSRDRRRRFGLISVLRPFKTF